MKNIQLNIPLPDMSSMTELDLRIMLAAKLYETEQLSLGQAAAAAGLSKRTFTELLGNYGVSLFSQNVEGLREDIANA
jgi:predicted HTH domain antitoxin